jgi:hypothetical protein
LLPEAPEELWVGGGGAGAAAELWLLELLPLELPELVEPVER